MTARTTHRLRALGLTTFLLLCSGVMLLLLHASGTRAPGAGGSTLQVVLPEASNLATKADVRMGGVRVGQVQRVKPYGANVVAELRLDDDAGPIFRNAESRLRYKSALNEGYVDLVRGGGHETRMIPDGGVLPLSAAQESVKVDEFLSTLDSPARRRLKGALDGLGVALDDRGPQLNDTIGGLSATVERGGPLFATLAGQREDVGRLVDDFADVARSLGDRETALRLLARRARTTSETVASRADQLRAMLVELPRTLRQLGASSSELAGLSGRATPVVADLARASDALAPALRRLRPAAARTRVAVEQLSRLLPRAEPLLDRLRPFATAASQTLGPLDGVLRQLNPLTAYLSSQRDNISTFFATYTSATQSTDATGHVSSLSFLFNKEALTAYLPPAGLSALEQLEDAGILSAIGGKIDRNPYPENGTVGDPEPFTGSYPRLYPQPKVLDDAP